MLSRLFRPLIWGMRAYCSVLVITSGPAFLTEYKVLTEDIYQLPETRFIHFYKYLVYIVI